MVKRSKKHSYSNLIQNDDYAEKRRRRSSIRQASDNRRTSLANVARDTFRRPGGSNESNVPLMANFEEWMKLVKDNKINQTNSWNFALIDYFHDMAVLKEGDGINFQKASYTLDGCVKIYTSRVDSVASETGKLLSGLADGGKELKNAQDENNENEEDEEDEEEKKRKQKRRKQRSEATLASSFDQLQVKNLDLELSVDPLFRKMCSDFNEGGAKGLLLNSLAIDNTGRVVFDGQMDQEPDKENGKDDYTDDKNEFSNRQIESIDLGLIKEGFFADLNSVDNLSICPSLPVLQTALTDPDASEFMKDIENGTVNAANIDNANVNIEFEGAFSGNIADFEDDDIPGDAVYDDQDEPELEFGVPDNLMHQDDDDEQQNLQDGMTSAGDNPDEDGIINDIDGQGAITVLMNNVGGNQDSDVMAYFDETLRKNWAGPEHWRVQRIKNLQNPNGNMGLNNASNNNNNNMQNSTNGENEENTTPSAELSKKRTDKQAFFIDFLSDENDIDEATLFAEGSASLNMPKTQQKSKTRNLLPDDEHFSSKSLIHLFLKPKAHIFRKSKSTIKDEDKFVVTTQEDHVEDDDILVDENFFAENQQLDTDLPTMEDNIDDGNIFGDDHGDDENLDGSQFHGTTMGTNSASQGNLLLGNRKARPEYVNYAKTAKKVNIKLLKDNIWNVLDIPDHDKDDSTSKPVTAVDADGEVGAESGENPESTANKEEKVIKFTDMVQGLRDYYPPQQLSDISTSFCFISLLHLANEKGLIIEDNEDNTELSIRKDVTVSRSELSA